EPLIATTLLDEEIHEAYLTILDREDRSVVTVIEVLSPTNKHSGSAGQRSYRDKRREIMTSSSHLMEIDLLRAGVRMAVRETLPPYDYLIHVSRVEERPKGRLWPVPLADPLPTVAVPLRSGDEDVPLNLQQILDSVYDRAAYQMEIDYHRGPTPPLSPSLSEWVDHHLKAETLRPANGDGHSA
ncbi:MAG: DUF4058 family protein, partial [Planctomycetaceae bacterium]